MSTKSGGFSAEEKAAMRQRIKEMKSKQDGETAVREAIAAMAPRDRAIAKGIHALVTEAAPMLTPKTWYGMPAYANADGKVVMYFRDAQKFKERYALFGFNDAATLDQGELWPVAFAVSELTPVVETKLRSLVKKATKGAK